MKRPIIFSKNQTDTLLTSGRIGLIIRRTVSAEEYNSTEHNPVVSSVSYHAEVTIDGKDLSGDYSLWLGSKMKQIGIIRSGVIHNLRLEEPGTYEIIIHALPSREEESGRGDQSLARPD